MLPRIFNGLGLASTPVPLARVLSRKKASQNIDTDFGTMGLSLVHDLSSAVTALLLDIERLRLDSHAIEESLRTAQQQIHGLADNRIRLGHELRRVMGVFSADCESRSIFLSLHIEQECEAIGNTSKLHIALNNLVRNAIDAVTGQLDASIQLRLNIVNDSAHILIVDNGPGIPKVRQRQMFAYGFSTKQKTTHMGIGLTLVKRIIERDLGGRLHMRSGTNGTTFTITIPRVA